MKNRREAFGLRGHPDGYPYHSEAMNRSHQAPVQADDDDGTGRPSRSAQKRESHALQNLGEQLLELPVSHLADLTMSDRLREAIVDCKKMKLGEGRRRQMQFIGRLMRDVDPEPLREAVAAFQLGHARNALSLHQAEQWRDRLIANDDALTQWLQLDAGADVQHLRALIRQARKDAQVTEPQERPGEAVRHGKAYREIFQHVKAALARGEGDEPGDPA